MTRFAAVILAGCAHAATPVPPTTTAAACGTPEYRELDFWVGDWTLAVHARNDPKSEQWRDSIGTQHISATLSRCAVEENFQSTGPDGFAGRSFSTFDKNAGKWRQTWVDDSGGYLAFTGGREGEDFVLYGEPKGDVQMRMVFSKVARDSLHWEWQRSEDRWATHAVMISIEYKRS